METKNTMSNKKHVACINKVRTELKNADPSIGYIRFKLAGENGITGQYIEYSQAVEKRNGTIKQVEKKSFIAHSFCPFCGEAYE
jgi:hypothetical protein